MIEWTAAGPKLGPSADAGALDRAMASSSVAALLERIPDDRSLLVVVNDPTRSTATSATLRALHARAPAVLLRARVLVATGSHAFGPADRAAYEASLTPRGQALAIAWHDARATELVEVAPRGARSPQPARGARFHPWLAGATHVLAIGSVEPHYFGGLTGAHKTLTIGCVSRGDIERNHRLALEPETRILRLDGNPVFDDVAAMVRTIAEGRDVLALNQIVHDGRVVDVAVGAPLATVRALRDGVINRYATRLERVFDVVHLRVPSPLGRSFYQADKALKNHGLAVRDGGAIVLEAACEEGLGQDDFVELLRAAPTLEGALRVIDARGYRLGDHKAVLLRRLMDPACRGVRVHLVSPALDARALDRTGIALHRSVDDALAILAPDAGPRAAGLRVEDAAMCVSQVDAVEPIAHAPRA